MGLIGRGRETASPRHPRESGDPASSIIAFLGFASFVRDDFRTKSAKDWKKEQKKRDSRFRGNDE